MAEFKINKVRKKAVMSKNMSVMLVTIGKCVVVII